MSTVSRSAAVSSAQLFSAVGAAATSLTTTFTVIGDAADVLAVKSQDWLHDTKQRSIATRIERQNLIEHEVATQIATRAKEVKKIMDGDPDFKTAYMAALTAVREALAKPQE